MIINAIRAENFMKFSSLKISGIPTKGIIGIEGPNESGKTTIGEVILFAFFGKTRTSLETSVSRLINWGADFLSVEVEFSIPDRGDYMIYREIDKYGTNFVKVIDLSTRSEVATGNVNVSEFLARSLKFDFFEFHQSFYHDQRQFGMSAEAQSNFMDRMTGIAQIQETVLALKKEIEQLEREFAHYQKDIQRNLQQMEKYERNAAKLPELRDLVQNRMSDVEQAREDHHARQEECEAYKRLAEEQQKLARRFDQLAEEPADSIQNSLEEIRCELNRLSEGAGAEQAFAQKEAADLQRQMERIAEIQEMLRSYNSLRAAFEDLSSDLRKRLDPESPSSLLGEESQILADVGRAERRGRRALLFCGLAILLALGSACGGVYLGNFEKLEINAILSAIRNPPVLWAALLLVFFLILSAVFLIQRIRNSRQAGRLQILADEQAVRIKAETEERKRVSALLEISGPGEVVRFIKGAEAVRDKRCVHLRREIVVDFQDLVELDGEGEYRKVFPILARTHREFRAQALRESQRLDRVVQEADGILKKARVDLEKVENEIRECEAQAAKKEALGKKNCDLESHSADIRAEIDLRRLSIELLEDSSASIRNKIGPSLSRFMRQMLPRLTSGRYRDIKVESDLSLQVFTSDKGDFMERSELSGGTQETLALALRLATSQAFIASRTRQSQFVFLDEPFKMMDEYRTKESLEILANLSCDIQQFFVIQPAFSAAQRQQFISLIRTDLDLNELVLDASRDGTSKLSTPSSQDP